jgi:hypothetical protein
MKPLAGKLQRLFRLGSKLPNGPRRGYSEVRVTEGLSVKDQSLILVVARLCRAENPALARMSRTFVASPSVRGG